MVDGRGYTGFASTHHILLEIALLSDLRGVASLDDRWTVAAVAVIAYVLADVGHEVVGHGIGYVLAGGRSGIFTTTRIIGDQRIGFAGSRVLDLGGPFGNLLFAGLGWVGQRVVRRPAGRVRLLLWLTMAFNLFWGVGYLMYSGVLDRGDWLALLPRTHLWIGRVVLVVVGWVLYRWSMRVVGLELGWIVSKGEVGWEFRVRRLVLLSYFAGGLIACAGAVLDPRGYGEMVNSGAASSFLAAVGLLFVPKLFERVPELNFIPEGVVARSIGWIVGAAAVSIFYIGVLGPGARFRF